MSPLKAGCICYYAPSQDCVSYAVIKYIKVNNMVSINSPTHNIRLLGPSKLKWFEEGKADVTNTIWRLWSWTLTRCSGLTGANNYGAADYTVLPVTIPYSCPGNKHVNLQMDELMRGYREIYLPLRPKAFPYREAEQHMRTNVTHKWYSVWLHMNKPQNKASNVKAGAALQGNLTQASNTWTRVLQSVNSLFSTEVGWHTHLQGNCIFLIAEDSREETGSNRKYVISMKGVFHIYSQIWEKYLSSHLSLCKRVNKHITGYVVLFLWYVPQL